MDMAFLLRAERLLERRPSDGIDYRVLVAALGAHQSASSTALAAAARRRCWQRDHGPLIELLAGGPAWREARRAQRGSFNRALATQRKGLSPARLPSHFSLPSTLARYRTGIEARLPGGQSSF